MILQIEYIRFYWYALIDTAPDIFENSNIEDHIKKIEEKEKIGVCPSCKKNIVDKVKFYGCSNYPNCKFTLSKDFRKKKLTKKNVSELLEEKETIVTNLKSKNGNKYNAKVSLNDNNFIEFIGFSKS